MNNECNELDILQKMVMKPNISFDDKQDLVSGILEFIEELILQDSMLCARSNYKDIIIEQIKEFLEIQLYHVYKNYNKYEYEKFLNDIIEESFYIYHLYLCPKREYGNTFIRKKPNIEKIRNKIDYLFNVPQPDQRTEEWYIFRHRYLTASSIWKVFSTPGSQNQLIYDKCKPLDTNKYKGFSTSSPMHWGHKYEPISIMWYDWKYNTTVSDFGCIPHRTIDYVAASPDGINTCSLSDRYGRMLEVKNIVNRDITGIPKPEYWIQMQVQMEVCELNECDFLETRFNEYESEEEFNSDGTFQYSEDGNHKGVILFFMNGEEPIYEYAPFMCSKEEYSEWEDNIMKKHSSLTWIQHLYWKLNEISCVLVLRNKTWFRGAEVVLKEFWETVQREKNGDYTHRAPKKRQISKTSLNQSVSKCLINVNTLTLDNVISNETNNTPPLTTETKIINISTQSFSSENYSQYLDDS